MDAAPESVTKKRRTKTPARPSKQRLSTPKSCPPRVTAATRRRAASISELHPKKLRVSKEAADVDNRPAATNPSASQTMDSNKAPRQSIDPFQKMQAFIENQFKTTNTNISEITQNLSKLDGKVVANTKELTTLKDNAKSAAAGVAIVVKRLQDMIERNDADRKADIRRLELASARSINSPSCEDLSQAIREEVEKTCTSRLEPNYLDQGKRDPPTEAYWVARKSFRLWPVPGNTDEDIWRECESFMSEKLQFPVQRLSGNDFESMSRVMPSARNTKIRDEILVVFKSTKTRDSVASYAKNLAKYIGPDGLPTAGLRAEIPDPLIGKFNDLERYGRILKRQHGNGLKRNIKFDDALLTLFMDVKLPNSDDWMKVTWEKAREEINEMDKLDSGRTREWLASSTGSASDMDTVPAPDHPNEGGSVASGANAMPRLGTLRRFGAKPSPLSRCGQRARLRG